jgi:DSF synthase
MQSDKQPNLPVTPASALKKSTSAQLTMQYEQLKTYYDPIYRALWCTLLSTPAPVFTPTLLSNIRSLQDNIAKYCFENPNQKPKYLIWLSDSNKVFSLGLDLHFIHGLIETTDEKGLQDYIQTCIDVFYINLMKLDISPLLTFSLIRGKAYGGGFEAALSSDIIVTEKNARCCFPEIRYHLLPSFGTLKMLLRRYPPASIHPLLFEGKNLQLSELHERGFIETIVEAGQGEQHIKEKLRHINDRHALYSTLYEAKIRNTLITYQELDDFKRMWVDAALHLKSDDLKRLGRLAHAQKKWSEALHTAK